ncbi:ferrous iron transport protein B [Streptococcus saliviloxodontae]|uniref:Ferrous iron transport protein B n=1 Tax=Streptococcus saliviloxodontae TaxID=1349416 RepID=A0ABS2PIY4_9STRE|nr:ferrous iron transport protein B [Streptococcus saliviloxodontae]MBM7635392.1 ferrous iron transport protein B [Streptococcus saliviloxodontae]
MEIALIGNPNSGKTSVFNLLTGANQRVGNWPGVTVERKMGYVKFDKTIKLQDLPGIYSLSPYTPEEQVARDYLVTQEADVILNIIDVTNLERNLYLTTQLLDLGIPVVLALNMSDVLESQGRKIRLDKLSYLMGTPVVATSALKNTGLTKAIQVAKKEAGSRSDRSESVVYDNRLEAAISQISDLIFGLVPSSAQRFYAIKLFEKDPLIWQELTLSDYQKNEITEIIELTEGVFTDDSESIVINERYLFIEKVAKEVQSSSDELRMTLSDQIDKIVTNRFLALPIFALAMFIVYFLAIQTVGTFWTDWVNDVLFGQYIPKIAQDFLNWLQVAGWLRSLIIDGVIAGVGTVLGFLPQIFVLFTCLGILEDIGYMSRIAFIMDRLFRRFGLSGKSFIPMLIATGCGVPAIMSSRTIENERDRRITIMTATFMPCSAKLEIIALITGAFFPENPFVAPSTYFIGLITIVLSGIALKKTSFLGGYTSPFIMELPTYHFPKLQTVLTYAMRKALSFVKRAGTIIFSLTVLIWFLSSYNWQLQQVDTDQSLLAGFGHLIAPIFSPVGFGNWKATVAAVTGLAAKETVVATFGILYHNNSQSGLWKALELDYSSLAAYSFLIFNLICAPCFAAIGAIKREMNHLAWTVGAIVFQTGLAYGISFMIYQFGLVLGYGKPITVETFLALLLVLIFCYFIFRRPKASRQEVISLSTLGELSKEV